MIEELSKNPMLLLLGLHWLRTTSSAGTVYHFVQGTCYQWSGNYGPSVSDNDWAKILAFHGGSDRLVTDRATGHVAFQAVASATRDGMVGVVTKPTYIPGLDPAVTVTWTITGVCG